MGRRRPRAILHEGLDRHPAVLAWRAVAPHGALPGASRSIPTERRGGSTRSSGLVRPGRRSSRNAVTRRWPRPNVPCYERLLPGLAVATPRCYGCIDDGEYGWLLLQAVEGAPYDESNRDSSWPWPRGGWPPCMWLPCRWGAPRRYRTLAPTDISPTSLADERGWKGAWAIPGPWIRWAGGPWRSSLNN